MALVVLGCPEGVVAATGRRFDSSRNSVWQCLNHTVGTFEGGGVPFGSGEGGRLGPTVGFVGALVGFVVV